MVYFAFKSNQELFIDDLERALLSYIYAKQSKEDFFLLIDDLDEKSQNYENITTDIIKKFSLETQEKIYISKNKNIYQNMALHLLKEQKAYACFCDEKKSCECQNLNSSKIETLKQEKSFSLKVKEPLESVALFDFLQNKTIEQKIEGFIILDQNGNPSSSFSQAIDTMLYNISTIFTHKDKLQESLEQCYIQKLLDFKKHPQYAHLKSLQNSLKVQELLEKGFLPDAIINYIIALHFSMPQELFYLPDAIKELSWQNYKESKEAFSLEKLQEYNKKHLLRMDSKRLSSIVGFADSDIGELLKLYVRKYASINELEAAFKKIFSPKKCDRISLELSSLIFEAPMIDDFETFQEYLIKKSSYSKEEIQNALYHLFGIEKDIDLIEAYSYLKPYLLEVAQCQS